jgi:hypothetical protein
LDLEPEDVIYTIEFREQDPEVIALSIQENKSLTGLLYIIERGILNVAEPTEAVTDSMISTALTEIIEDVATDVEIWKESDYQEIRA